MFLRISSVLLLLTTASVFSINLKSGDVTLSLETEDDSTRFKLLLGDEQKMSGIIGRGLNLKIPANCEGAYACLVDGDGFILNILATDGAFRISWIGVDNVFTDCIDLASNDIHWVGGPEHWNSIWPIESTKMESIPYVTSRNDNAAVSERYWLNSKGGYVFVANQVPLFVDQNHLVDDSICFIGKIDTPYLSHTFSTLDYSLIAKSDAKEAHLHAINNYLGKPSGHPNYRMIKEPIWTTWAKYKQNIDDDIVRSFAEDIASKGFVGQIEIDDYWEKCYGSLSFNDEKFKNIGETVEILHNSNFTVTLWTHPFVNENCEEFTKYGKEHDLFIKDKDGNDVVSWWDGEPAYHIDFTKEEGAEWFSQRLTKIQESYNIDNFKFDAGESDWAPPNPVLSGDPSDSPNSLTEAYVRTCAAFGERLEVRSGWRTQDLPIFVRMLDKDSRWGLDNGLHAIIVSTMQMNMVGYTIVLPDMVGGNGYGEKPTAELLMRWLAANVFLPTIQFSYLPWETPSDEYDTLEITKKFVKMHEDNSDKILDAIQASVQDGTPVNPPIWWVDPLNLDAWKVNDEFLLGENILVAPVIEEGATARKIYLPTGLWKDGNSDSTYEGPITIDYSAPIDVLPYFIKQ